MVCAPAVAEVGMLKPELISIPPLVLITDRPTGVPAVIAELSKRTVIASFATNPEPVIAIVVLVLRVPDCGVILIEGDDTLNGVVAVFIPSDNERVYAPGM